MQQTKNLLTIREASQWASDFLKRDVSESNISYLVQYGKVKKHNGGSSVFVDLNDLKSYYDSYRSQREIDWEKKLGNDLNWALSFDHLREVDTTKHVHRLFFNRRPIIYAFVGGTAIVLFWRGVWMVADTVSFLTGSRRELYIPRIYRNKYA
ncbi:MAG: hypothetical protein COS58_01900 [Candidatus Tagabacteria bacterium CG03_land_8_20_14_0_80_41_22]|uniref:Uncharacterized protein n=2 Tax=Candidatus Tagaibacteriota TaxID=1817918 RepID=A0A2M7B8Z2_9BACT|nr:MAG: hypothetical protein COS58_01900 [Candidatus Tagabacteria bacterium CG03_land_8_20_14_0_80_41_22]